MPTSRQWFPANEAAGLSQSTARMLPNAPWNALSGVFPIDPAAAWGDLTHRFFEGDDKQNTASHSYITLTYMPCHVMSMSLLKCFHRVM